MKGYDVAVKTFAGIFGIIFLIIIVSQLTTIIPFQYAPGGTPLVVVPVDNIFQSISDALWGPRLVDTLAQVILLFVAAAGAAALFRLEKKASTDTEEKEMEVKE